MQTPLEVIQRQSQLKMIRQARVGCVIYLAIWFAITLPTKIYQLHADFFLFNTIILALLGVYRELSFQFAKRLDASREDDAGKVKQCFMVFGGSVYCSGLHWGSMCAYVVFFLQQEQFNILFITSLSGLTAVSLIYFGQSVLFAMGYYLGALVPVMVLGLSSDNSAYQSLAMIFSLYAMGLLSVGRQLNAHYKESFETAALAQQQTQKLKELSAKDGLTGIFNRHYFDKNFANEWRQARRDNQPLSLIILDIDHFKTINDTYGHVVGDKALVAVAECLQGFCLRQGDFVTRFGGEEFVVIYPGTDTQTAEKQAENMLAAIAAISIDTEQGALKFTASAGLCCTVPELEQTPEQGLDAADKALYQAKGNGRDQYRVA